MSSRNLPEDIVIEILSRLPVKSLMRFKCACKSWYVLIKNPTFKTHWANFNNHNRGRGLLLQRRQDINQPPCFSFLSNDTLEVCRDVNVLAFFPDEIYEVSVLGPCSGILCLVGFGPCKPLRDSGLESEYCYDIVLWNPTTRESKLLPCPPDLTVFPSVFGFGIDPKTNDFKVVRIAGCRDERKVLVYNLSTDSWRVINTKLPVSFIGLPHHPSYLNGAHHWFSYGTHNNTHYLLSFDLSNEVFHETLLPPFLEFGNFSNDIFVREEEESIAFILSSDDDDARRTRFDIWVMNASSAVEKATWTKKLTIGPLPGGYFYFREFREDGMVLLENEDGWLVLYNPSTQELKNLQIRGFLFQVVSYREALVSLNGGNVPQQQDNS